MVDMLSQFTKARAYFSYSLIRTSRTLFILICYGDHECKLHHDYYCNIPNLTMFEGSRYYVEMSVWTLVACTDGSDMVPMVIGSVVLCLGCFEGIGLKSCSSSSGSWLCAATSAIIIE